MESGQNTMCADSRVHCSRVSAQVNGECNPNLKGNVLVENTPLCSGYECYSSHEKKHRLCWILSAFKIGVNTLRMQPWSARYWLLMLLVIYAMFILSGHFGVQRNITALLTMKPQPLCSKHFFRKYIHEHHRYPHHIKSDADFSSFWPEGCLTLEQNVEQCLRRKKIRSIAVYGASQVMKYMRQLLESLKKHGMSCKVTKREDRKPTWLADLKYFADGDATLRSRMVTEGKFNCRGCSGSQAVCTATKDPAYKIHVEYISTENIRTQYVTLKSLNGSAAVPSYEEFIFNVHLKDSFPDLNVFFLPMNHIKQKPVQNFTHELPGFLTLFKKAKSPNSELFFIPGISEQDKSRSAKYKMKRWFGLKANDAIRSLNAELFSVLEPDILNPTSNLFSFLDLFEVTLPLVDLCEDGLHYKKEWYLAFWKVFLNVYCQD